MWGDLLAEKGDFSRYYVLQVGRHAVRPSSCRDGTGEMRDMDGRTDHD